MSDEITYRRAAETDAERTYNVFLEAADDLNRKMGRPQVAGGGAPPARAIRFRHSSVRHDHDRFWVAEAGGRIVGFAIATLRDDVWYLAALHVVPEYQSRGIGTELIRRSLSGTGPSTVLTVFTDAANPASNGLYLRFGMLPQEPILTFDGPIRGPGTVPAPESRGASGAATEPGVGAPFDSRPIDLATDQPALAGLDRGAVGFARPMDHEFWAGVEGLDGRMLVRGGDVQGYLYVSSVGQVGPIAVGDSDDVPPALDVAADLARVRGATSLHIRIAGSAWPGQRWILERGLRLSGIGLMLSSSPVGRLDRYVSSGGDALY